MVVGVSVACHAALMADLVSASRSHPTRPELEGRVASLLIGVRAGVSCSIFSLTVERPADTVRVNTIDWFHTYYLGDKVDILKYTKQPCRDAGARAASRAIHLRSYKHSAAPRWHTASSVSPVRGPAAAPAARSDPQAPPPPPPPPPRKRGRNPAATSLGTEKKKEIVTGPQVVFAVLTATTATCTIT